MGFFDIFRGKKKDTAPAPTAQTDALSDEQAQRIADAIGELSKKAAYRLVADDSRRPGLCDTKFGGVPYWDMSQEYPVSSTGEKLMLLAQINLSDAADCELLPDSGLLQFFIRADDMYGADFDNCTSNDSFRVVYHKEIDESVTKEDVLALDIPTSTSLADEDALSPLAGEVAVNVEKTLVSVGVEDFMYDRYLHEAAQTAGIKLDENKSAFTLLPDDIFDAAAAENAGHWLFGYAYFTQSDPREYTPDLSDYILLFQMDSDYASETKVEILWGDVGVGNFFIKPEDLEKLDFSKVMYTWDCC